MQLYETEPFDQMNDTDDFEDFTKELFDAVDNELEDCGLICAPSFTFDETMTSFELMDKKMDMRFQRNNVTENNQQLLKELNSLNDELPPGKKLALMRELLR